MGTTRGTNHDHVDEVHDSDDIAGEWQIESVTVESDGFGRRARRFSVAAAAITTAAALAEAPDAESAAENLPPSRRTCFSKA